MHSSTIVRRVHSRQLLRAFVALVAGLCLFVTAIPLASAQSWLANFYCLDFTNPPEVLRVESQAVGTVDHWRGAYPSGALETLYGRWTNNTVQWRTSFHGTGQQSAFVYTNGSLYSQKGTCI